LKYHLNKCVPSSTHCISSETVSMRRVSKSALSEFLVECVRYSIGSTYIARFTRYPGRVTTPGALARSPPGVSFPRNAEFPETVPNVLQALPARCVKRLVRGWPPADCDAAVARSPLGTSPGSRSIARSQRHRLLRVHAISDGPHRCASGCGTSQPQLVSCSFSFGRYIWFNCGSVFGAGLAAGSSMVNETLRPAIRTLQIQNLPRKPSTNL